jgi:hypothetical protein
MGRGVRGRSAHAGSVGSGHVEAFGSRGRVGSVPRGGARSRSTRSRAHECGRACTTSVPHGSAGGSVRALAGSGDGPMGPSPRVMNSV